MLDENDKIDLDLILALIRHIVMNEEVSSVQVPPPLMARHKDFAAS